MPVAAAQHRRRSPRPGDVWVHVDRFDRPDGKVWAVQHWSRGKLRYEVAKTVRIGVPCSTVYLGYRAGSVSAAVVCPNAIVARSARGLAVLQK